MTAERIAFWVVAVVVVVGALGVVAAPRAVYSAICLAVGMIGLAVLYVGLDAPFLGVVQVVVYTGAVMMLFLFVLMLVGVDSADSLTETLRGQRVAALLTGAAFGILLIGGIAVAMAGAGQNPAPNPGPNAVPSPPGEANVTGLAVLVFTRYLWAFELTSALLITAALGAMMLAHRERLDRRPTQRELAVRRFAPGGHPTPLPNPGVYARHNAVDLPALLPDGSTAPSSVTAILEPRSIR